MIDTVIFDLDGTLLNTLDDLMDSTNYALAQLGCPPRTYDEIRSFVGEGVRLLIERALPDDRKDETDRALAVFSAHYDVHKADKTRPYDGIADMLTAVQAAGYRMAIVSNKYDAAVQDLRARVFPQISVAVGEREGLAKKPAPDGVLLALRQLGALPQNAVYVGDSDVDVRTARNAGLPIVAVTWGFRDRALLQRLGADVIIDAPDRLPEAIKQL